MRVLEIDHAGTRQRVATFLTDDEIALLHGLPPQAIVGVHAPDGTLQINAVFREFLHHTIATAAPLDPALQSAAQSNVDGRLVYIDDRLPETADTIPDEDILGWFRVREGRIVPGSYLPNQHHKMEGTHGFTAAVAAMRRPMFEALRQNEPS